MTFRLITFSQLSVTFFFINLLAMCGRFCCSLEPNSLKSKVVQDNYSKHKELDWVDQDKYYPSYNVCPTNKVIVMRNEVDKNQHVLQSMVSVKVDTCDQKLIIIFKKKRRGAMFLAGHVM